MYYKKNFDFHLSIDILQCNPMILIKDTPCNIIFLFLTFNSQIPYNLGEGGYRCNGGRRKKGSVRKIE